MVVYGSTSPSLQFIDKWFIVILIGLWALFTLIVYLSFTVSLHLVGPFERIMGELDETIAGKIRRPIKARAGDDLANALLRRVNILIDNLPLPKAPLRTR